MPTPDQASLIVDVLYHYGADRVPEGYGNRNMRCPFHDDRVASASVNVDEGLFYCHTCGVGGDAISLIRHAEGADFATAKRIYEEVFGGSSAELRRERDAGSWLPRYPRNRRGHSDAGRSRRGRHSRSWA